MTAGFGEDEGQGFVFNQDGQAVSPAMIQAEIQRREMEREAFFADLNRLIFEELPFEVVELFRKLLHDLAETADPRSQANYLEGLLTGATEARKRLSGPDVRDLGYMAQHGYVVAGEPNVCGFPGCGLPPQAKPHQ